MKRTYKQINKRNLAYIILLIISSILIYFLINHSIIRIFDRIYENLIYLIIPSFIAIVAANCLKLKKNFLSFFFIILFFLCSLYLKNIITYLEFLGTDSFDAVQKTSFNEILFFLRTLEDELVLTRINFLTLLFSFIIFFLHLVFINFVNLKLKILNRFLVFFLLIISIAFIIRVSIIVDTPKNFQEKVVNNFNNKFVVSEKIKNNMNLIVHIGESTSSMNWSLYGYFRDTNPRLMSLDENELMIFRNIFSTHTHTTPSLLDTFAFDLKKNNVDYANQTAYETPKINIFEILKKKQIPLINISNSFGNFEYSILFNEIKTIYNQNHPYKEDEFFYSNFDIIENIFNKNKRSVSLFHSYVSHGPYLEYLPVNFHRKVDDFYKKFIDDKKTHLKEIFGNRKGALNASLDNVEDYDTAMVFLDYLIFQNIKKIKRSKYPIVYIYFSDHGESVYTNKGHDSSRFVHEMATIPFLIYFNETAKKEYPILYQKYLRLSKEKNISSLKNFSSTMMDLLGMRLDTKVVNNNVIKQGDRTEPIHILKRNTLGGRSSIIFNNLDSTKSTKFKNKISKYSRIFDISQKYEDKKICYHRSNSISKIIRSQLITNCFEIDLNIKNEKFEIFHTPDISSKLNIDDIFKLSKNYEGHIWIDVKDFYKNKNCEILINKFKKKFFNQNILFEFSHGAPNLKNLECFSELKKKGYNTAYQLETSKLNECKLQKSDCSKLFKKINSYNFLQAFSHLSFNKEFKDFIFKGDKFVDNYNFALWGLESNNKKDNLLLDERRIEYVIYDTSDDPNSIE